MVAIGIAYLLFEKKLLAKSKLRGESTAPTYDSLSRLLIGIQVGQLDPMLEVMLTLGRLDSLFCLWS
jgi:hypothetical protein